MSDQLHHIRPAKIFLKFFSVFVALFLLSSCSDEPKLFQPLNSNAVILAFGDSLTFGKGAQKYEAYPAVLSQLSSHTVINAGISGEVSTSGLARLPALLKQHHPSMVILCHGGNDLLRGLNLNKTAENLRKMIDLSRQAGAQVYLLAVPKPSLTLKPPALYQQVATETATPVNMHLLPSVLGKREFKSDTYHPNANGYREMAETIYDELKTLGAF